jgi:hypothetical protein
LETLTPEQLKAFTMLAAGRADKEVAEECGVCTKTISRWKAKEDFQQLLRESSARMFDAAISELCLGSIEAAKELRRIINDAGTPSRTKIAAIQTLLSMASKAKESLLEQRLESIEAALDADISNEA